MDNFKTIGRAIFEILGLENITGFNAIRHFQILLGMKQVIKEVSQKFDIPSEYIFENFLKDKKGNIITDPNVVLTKFYNPDSSKMCLLKYIIEKGKFYNFEFQIQYGINFVNIYKKLVDINLSELKLDKNCFDLYGEIFQVYLNKCNSITKKELGVHFTNRYLTKYIINLCNPKCIDNNIETILDPSCGTGGFLALSVKYLNDKYSNIEWNINKKNIYGFDNNSVCRNITAGSLLIETGELFDTIDLRDTLCNDLKINNVLIDNVDIIMCELPYGIRNFKFANVCPRVKQLKFDGTKAEPLFLQLIMQSLKKGGRAAIIVPDNLLENTAKQHSQTREYLVKHLNLKKVINIDDNLINLGIKQSIIYFENNGKTESVEFSKFKFENNKCVEEKITSVEYNKLVNKKYNLDVNKYILDERLVVSTESSIKIIDFCNCKINNHTSDNYIKKNMIVINNENIIYYDSSNIPHTQTIIINKKSILIEEYSKKLNLKYVYYYLQNMKHNLIKNLSNKNIDNIEYIKNIVIPILPNDVISNIITNLDLYEESNRLNKSKIHVYNRIVNNTMWSYCYNKPLIKLSEIATISIIKQPFTSGDTIYNLIYINKLGDITLSNDVTKTFCPYISIKIISEFTYITYVYYYLKYNTITKKIIESDTIGKLSIENLNIALLSKNIQLDIISLYDSMLCNINMLSVNTNDNIISRILGISDDISSPNSNFDEFEHLSSCSSASKNINQEF